MREVCSSFQESGPKGLMQHQKIQIHQKKGPQSRTALDRVSRQKKGL